MSIELPPGTAAYSNSNPPPQNRQVLTLTLMFLGSLGLAIGAAIWLAGALDRKSTRLNSSHPV